VRARSRVKVLETFTSDGCGPCELKASIYGFVEKIDEDGDAKVKFEGIGCNNVWVFEVNFHRLQVVSQANEDSSDKDVSETVEEMGRRDSNASVSSVVWMPDESACSCTICEEPFTMFRRRHHCRACGLICCAECAPRTSSAWPSLLMRTATTYKRLCKDCAKGLPSLPMSPTYVKNTFIDVKDTHPTFVSTAPSVSDSFPY